jgi:hypothetical protein
MFLTLARWFQEQDQASTPSQLEASALRVFDIHPALLARALEEAYGARDQLNPRGPFPSPGLPYSVLGQLDSGLAAQLPDVQSDIYPLGGGGEPFLWRHLIYAYAIEQTRVFEIFNRVLFEYLHGERLEVPSQAGQRWLRATEDLLYRDAPSAQILAVTSWIRPDIRAARRNAYWRLFGLDLAHGKDDGTEYPYEKAIASNVDFVSTFEEFGYQVWRGIENVVNTSGSNPTDDAAIANRAHELFDMLRVRRRSGNLSREEFVFVTMMSWLHLTLLFDSPIVRDLKAEATSPEQRLQKIGDRVDMPADPKSESYFKLAEPLSRVLIAIETGLFNSPATAPALYAPGALRDDMMTSITHWSMATGRDLKAHRVAVSPAMQPAPPPANGQPANGQPAPGVPMPA